MQILDLFCGEGGAAYGYFTTGFEVYGVDIEPQPNYPFWFHQGDALEVLCDEPTLANVLMDARDRSRKERDVTQESYSLYLARAVAASLKGETA